MFSLRDFIKILFPFSNRKYQQLKYNIETIFMDKIVNLAETTPYFI